MALRREASAGRSGRAFAVALGIFALIAAGCGDDDVNGGDDALIAQHEELLVGSTAPGGGELTGQFEFERSIALFFSACVGGQGDDCAGGMVLYSAANPGVEALEEDDPDQSLYTLEDGTELSIEVTAIDEPLTIRVEDTTLSKAGDSAVLGTLPDLHADADTQLVLPGGTPFRDYDVSFRLRAAGTAYDASQEYTLHFLPVAEPPPEGSGDED